ncbi:Heat shock protein DnaJ [Penicillium griseofulvum]|uniref:Heat shock protein DnaJ n=1 Tax=Penicillium patulum TaxID=5078 RepID=A0A135M012_PENPA|nr:Heat shock protein DnaJ [Penicillium griseofulvum]KXG54552.1 Heat shock protein DnaJ [Penicillium griseofulvum]
MSADDVTTDAYAILGVEWNARIQDINLAYKRLALKLHPDKAGNSPAAIERFRKVQDAVELLRDEDRRHLLDEALKKKTKRHLDPEDDRAYRGSRQGSSKRERHGFDFEYWPGQLYQRQYDDDYYYSYGTSVHMDPNSAENKAKRAQFQAENIQWENEWAGIDPEEQKARAQSRKDSMRARVQRDLEEMSEEDFDDLASGQGPNFKEFMDALPEENTKTCNPADTFDSFSYEYSKQFGSSPVRSGCTSSSRSTTSSASNDPSVNISTSGNPTNYAHSPGEYWNSKSTADNSNEYSPNYFHPANDHWSSKSIAEYLDERVPGSTNAANEHSTFASTAEDSNDNSPNYTHPANDHWSFKPVSEYLNEHVPESTHPANDHWNFKPIAKYLIGHVPDYTHSSNEHSTSKFTAEDSESTTTDSTSTDSNSDADKLINSFLARHESFGPLVSFYKQKLADPQGRYTVDDLAGELNGLVLETYCGWLEDIRLSFPNASRMTARTDPSNCSHRGFWDKEFCRPMCNVCNMWMPTYILTCPGCGVMACVACVRCKFTGSTSFVGSLMQGQ